jgi:hypothetical protein
VKPSRIKQLAQWANGESVETAFPAPNLDRFRNYLRYPLNLSQELSDIHDNNRDAPLHPVIQPCDLILP